MKRIFIHVFLCTSFIVFSQSSSDFQIAAQGFGGLLNSVCSSASHDLEVSIDWDSFKTNYYTESAEAKIEVSWVGSWTKSYYWIKGRLVLDGATDKIHWYKISDSGGFPSNCSRKLERKYEGIVVH